MAITAAQVKELREMTGAGMMDCKNALVEADGDFDKAIEILRKKGQKVAAKRADRDSSEGAAIAKVNTDNSTGVIISLNCETDFVAKNESFVTLANNLADLALDFDNKDAFLAASFDGMTVAEKLTEQTGVIGEKIEIGGFGSRRSREEAEPARAATSARQNGHRRPHETCSTGKSRRGRGLA